MLLNFWGISTGFHNGWTIFIPTNGAYGFSFLHICCQHTIKPPGNSPRVIFFLIFKNCFYLSVYFWLHRVLACSSCGRWQLLSSVVCRLSLWWPLPQSMGSGHSGFSAYGSQAWLPWGKWDPPSLGIKPGSPTLGGGFSCTVRMSLFVFERQLTYNTMLVPIIKSFHLWHQWIWRILC